MIRVTAELIPFGDKTHPGRKILGTADIINKGTGTPTAGNYVVEFRGKAKRKLWTVTFERFPRKRMLVWDLLYRALERAVGHRN